MDDTIYRRDAIDALNVCVTIGRGNGKSVAFKIANDYADIVKKRIEALPSAQPESVKRTEETIQNVSDTDLISRQEAINALKFAELGEEIEVIERLPSVQQNRIQKELDGKTAEEIADFLSWLMYCFVRQYTDSRAGLIMWLKGEV